MSDRRPWDGDGLAGLERMVWADDRKFAAGMAMLRPCEPREYRRRRRWRGAGIALVAVGFLLLAAWAVLGWAVGVLFTLKSATVVVLLAGGDVPDQDGSAS